MASSKSLAATVLAAMLMLSIFQPSLGIASTATFYDTYYPSSCYGNDPLPSDNLFAAAAPSIFNNKAACGSYYTVTCTGSPYLQNACTGATIRVKIVDLCPGCAGAFDLSKEAFAQIANTDAGTINIEYNQS